jgi:hypothetical protein
MPDLIDVGVSSVLRAGFGFFDLLNAAPATLPYGLGGHQQRGPEIQRFHVLHSIQKELGPLCYTGSHVSVPPGHVRRPGLDCLPFWPSLIQPRMALSL